MVYIIVLISFFITAWLTYRLVQPDSKVKAIDIPNDRSLHSKPTPRTGGLAILLGIAIAGAILVITQRQDFPISIIAGVFIIFSISYWDDKYNVKAAYRLLLHILAALLVVLVGAKQIVPPHIIAGEQWSVLLSIVVTIIFLVWMTNLYNFMDGMDGLAAGMTIIGFSAMGILGWLAGNTLFSIFNFIVAMSSLGFLIWNFPPARIFMGDAGSSTLGFLAAVSIVWADQTNIAPIWISVLVFFSFVMDASITLLRRTIKGEKVWMAHKTHFYQRLVQLGWGHRKTVLWEYGLMILCAVSALAAVRLGTTVQISIVLFWVAIYSGIGVMVLVLESKNKDKGCI